jgi:hypothetical protein
VRLISQALKALVSWRKRAIVEVDTRVMLVVEVLVGGDLSSERSWY